MTKRVFDDPNHRHYGPIRRMWVVLAQLCLLEDADLSGPPDNPTWDIHMAAMLTDHPAIPESTHQVVFLHNLMTAYLRSEGVHI